jgi:hypothetical protein
VDRLDQLACTLLFRVVERLIGILRSVVGSKRFLVAARETNMPERCAVRSEFVYDNNGRTKPCFGSNFLKSLSAAALSRLR